jgi:septum formation protein
MNGGQRSLPPRVVLASQSPRRRDLLSLIGIAHVVRPADVDETMRAGESPDALAERLARAMALAVRATEPDAIVIGSDTIVVLDGEVLGKPASADDARAMLRRLSARTHTVVTAVAVVRGDRVASGVERVTVTFRALDEHAIDRYVATGEPMDKAGAYGIQGFGATIVERVDGDYFAVMGLALGRLIELLASLGVGYGFGDGLLYDAP